MDIDPTVLVLGGGPAGTTTALLLAQTGINTTVCERSHYDSPRIGEVLPPATKPLLQTIGVWSRFAQDGHLRSPGVLSAWERPLTHESDFLFNPYGNGWHLERVQFDRFLAASAEAEGAEVYCGGRPVGVARTASGWRVEVRFADHLITFRCKFLVDATGRSCWLAHRLGARRQKMDCLVGIVAQIRTDSSREYDRRLLLEAVEGGWWYSGYLPNDTLIATFMTDMATAPQQIDDPFTFWRRSVEQTDYTLKRLAKERPPSSVKVVSANSYLMSSVAGDSWLAIGDAAMAWDPLSSQGIFRAIQDGTRAAKCIGAALLGDDMALREYSNHTNVTYDRYRESRDYYYGLVRRWPKSEFWLQRQPSQTP